MLLDFVCRATLWTRGLSTGIRTRMDAMGGISRRDMERDDLGPSSQALESSWMSP